MKPTLEDFSKLLKDDKQKSDRHYYGVVQSLIYGQDGKVSGYNVSLGNGSDSVACRKLAGAKVGDTVLVTLMQNGVAIVTGTINGDTDAADAQEAAEDITGRAESGEFSTLTYDTTYIPDPDHDNQYIFTAHLWEGKTEVTSSYPETYFVWYYKTDPDATHPDGLYPILNDDDESYGYTMTVDVSDDGNAPIGFRGTVVGRFSPSNDAGLTNEDDEALQTDDDQTITGRTSAEGFIKVTELPVQTPVLTDQFMGIGAEREYRATLGQLKTLMLADLDADKNYVHTQDIPSAAWTVTHNLGKRPAITVVDSAGTDVIGEYTYISDNQVLLEFSGAFSGKAYFN